MLAYDTLTGEEITREWLVKVRGIVKETLGLAGLEIMDFWIVDEGFEIPEDGE